MPPRIRGILSVALILFPAVGAAQNRAVPAPRYSVGAAFDTDRNRRFTDGDAHDVEITDYH